MLSGGVSELRLPKPDQIASGHIDLISTQRADIFILCYDMY